MPKSPAAPINEYSRTRVSIADDAMPLGSTGETLCRTSVAAMSSSPRPTDNRDPDADKTTRRWRDYLIPKSVIGLVALVLAFSIGASLSGVGFYAFYQYQQEQTTERIDSYIAGFDERFRTASDTIDNEKQNAQAAIQSELGPLRQAIEEGNTTTAVAERVKPSVYFVQTQDAAGAPSVGTAFVVQSDENNSLLVTSYATVAAATATPGPAITLTKGDERLTAKLVNWVESQDVAVLSVPKGNLPALTFAPEGAQPSLGDRAFVVSGLGASGASAAQGFINNVSENSIMQDAPVGVAFQGGPLVNPEGQVLGVASLNYAPFGFRSSEGITFSLPIGLTCSELLNCPDNVVASAQGR